MTASVATRQNGIRMNPVFMHALRLHPLCANVPQQFHRPATAFMHRLRPTLLLLLGLLTAGILLTGGCGQKGDLYLPDRADSQK